MKNPMLFDRVIKAQIFISNQTGIMPKKCDNNLFAFSAIVIKNVSKKYMLCADYSKVLSSYTRIFNFFVYCAHRHIAQNYDSYQPSGPSISACPLSHVFPSTRIVIVSASYAFRNVLTTPPIVISSPEVPKLITYS